jgi:NADH-quinone oxidoreductase subunit A
MQIGLIPAGKQAVKQPFRALALLDLHPHPRAILGGDTIQIVSPERYVPFHFANVLLFAGTAVMFVFGSLLAGHFLRPSAPSREKNMIYECGEKPIGQAWFNFNPRFYLIALVFVIFEVEIAFMFPVASVYKWFIDHGQGTVAFLEIFLFVAILAVGLAYVWAMGDLEWVKGLKQDVLTTIRDKPPPVKPQEKKAA